ncbi:MAG: flagellar filament capping protein FliD [Bryobacteraceae bacterium]
MGSISSSLPSTGSLSLPTFNGESTFSASLQTQLDQAVENASQPIEEMQSEVSNLQSQQEALSGLQSAFGSLQSALTSIGSDSTGALSANVSNTSVATATAASGALPGTYTIQVAQVGTSTTTLSANGLTTVTDPTTGNISPSSSFTLIVNGTNFAISPAGNTLDDLATAINDAGAGVQATIVNVGGNSSPDYRLAVTSTSAGDTTIQLNDANNNPLLNTLASGTDAEYSVDGNSTQVQSTSNQVTLAPGLTVNLLQANSSPVTITVGANYSALSNDLSNFATAYNSAVSTLGQQIGQNAGPLSGQSIVYTLQGALNTLVNYTGGSGTVNSLASLGLTLGSTGQLSFDSTVFNSQSIGAIQQFLGGATTGGFLQTATNTLTGVADPSVGDIQSEFTSLQTEVTNENGLITNEETRVNDLTTNMEQQLTQADALIANLQEQKSYFTQLFQAEYPSSGSTG